MPTSLRVVRQQNIGGRVYFTWDVDGEYREIQQEVTERQAMDNIGTDAQHVYEYTWSLSLSL